MPSSPRIGRYRKVDVLFVVGIAVVLWGAWNRDVGIVIAGAGIAGIPITQRQDSA